MTAAREIADASPADLFAYAPLFVLIEQYVIILTSTLKTVGFTVAGELERSIFFRQKFHIKANESLKSCCPSANISIIYMPVLFLQIDVNQDGV